MALVEALGVTEEQMLHAARQRLAHRLDDEVDVVRHEAKRENVPAFSPGSLVQVSQERQPVVVVEHDRPPLDTAGGDVEQAVSPNDVSAREAWHRLTVRAGRRPNPVCGQIGTLLAQRTCLQGRVPGTVP